MFDQIYESELSYVRDLGKLYAKIKPAIAPLLAETNNDPDVERLIEGFAFLTARIRERIEDEAPEIIHSLLELLLPHYLRTIPAASILELHPIEGALRKRQRVPKERTELASKPVLGGACRFRTTADADVLPLRIADTKLEQPGSSRPIVRVGFESTVKDGRLEALQKDGIRLFIHGDFATASTFFLWLMRHLDAITVRGTSRPGGEAVRLGPEHLRALGTDPAFSLIPWPSFASDGYRILQEYFTLPQKFLFFDIIDLDRIRSRIQDDRFELAFELGPRANEGDPPKLPAAIGRGFLRLHCVPIINLFSAGAAPIRRTPGSAEHLLRPAGLDPAAAEVYSVDSVIGARRGERRTYQPFFSFAHAPGAEHHHLRRVRSQLDGGVDTYLSIVSPRDVSPELEEREDLSVELTCTNRSMPEELAAGDISVATPSSPAFASYDPTPGKGTTNITEVSRPARPPFGSELHWRLIAHLAISRRSLTGEGMIAALLSLYDFLRAGDDPRGRANRLRIESIRSVKAVEARRLVRGAPVRGLRTTVELDETAFGGPGDAFLFGVVLDELLAAQVSMNTFNELRLELVPSRRVFSFAPRSGRQKVL